MTVQLRTVVFIAAAAVFAVATARAQEDCDPLLRTPLGDRATDARLVETLGRIKLGPFEVSHIPAGAIAVEGIQLVGKEFFFTFHLNIDARSAKSKPTFSMAGPEVGGAVIKGSVRQLDVRGCLAIPGRTDEPRIEVPASRFFAEVLTPQASLPTTLAGIVTLRGHFVELRNRTGLRLSMAGKASSGTFDLTASNATTDAVEILAEGSKRSLLLEASFQLPGSSSWLFDLQNPKIRWESGRLRAAPVSLTADQPYFMPLPRLDLEFRELTIAAIEFTKTTSSSPVVSISIKKLSLNAGSAKLLGTPSVEGRFRAPLTASGTLSATFTEDAQIVIKDYELSDVSMDLEVATFSDGGSFLLRDSLITLGAKRLTASEVEGSLTIMGGHLDVNGQIGGSADIGSLDLHVSGKRDALDGTGSVDIAKLAIHGTTRIAPSDQCPGSTLDVDVKGAEVYHVTGNIQLVKGKAEGSIDVSRFKAAAGLSYYRCEWDHTIGHLNKVEMNGIPYPCGTWDNPFKFCQDHWVLWGGGDVSVRWVFVANPTLSDVGIEIADLKYDLKELKVCGGTISGLTLGLYAVSLTPNLPASGTVFDVFRDTIQTFQGIWQTRLVNTLGPALGALKVVQIKC
jgi:hypothetical protein